MLTTHLALLYPPAGSDPTSLLEGGEETSQGHSDLLGVEAWSRLRPFT